MVERFCCVNSNRLFIMSSAICTLTFVVILLSARVCHGNGIFGRILYSDLITCNHSKDLNINVDETQVFFYDFQNDYNISANIRDAARVIKSTYNLDMTRKLVVFVPGYKSHISRSAAEIIRMGFKDVPNIYLIILDHSSYTSSKGGRVKSYERSVLYTFYVGSALGNFLVDLRIQGLPSKNIHCIGHSLGSHMVGYAGKIYSERTGEKIARFTGIDPAGPCFSNDFIEEQLRSGLAEYVEVYHCNAGGLGTTSVLADTDFFFNNGRVQKQCDTSFLPGLGNDEAKCSHKACLRYWAESINRVNYYLAWACDSYDDFNDGKCAGNNVTIAGYSNPGNATGVFYVSTEVYGVE